MENVPQLATKFQGEHGIKNSGEELLYWRQESKRAPQNVEETPLEDLDTAFGSVIPKAFRTRFFPTAAAPPKAEKKKKTDAMTVDAIVESKYDALLVEKWLNRMLRKAHAVLGYVDKVSVTKSALEVAGIDRQSLQRAGLSSAAMQSLLRALFVYSSGFNEIVKKVCAESMDPKALSATAWVVFGKLLQACELSEYGLLIVDVVKRCDLLLKESEAGGEEERIEQRRTLEALKLANREVKAELESAKRTASVAAEHSKSLKQELEHLTGVQSSLSARKQELEGDVAELRKNLSDSASRFAKEQELKHAVEAKRAEVQADLEQLREKYAERGQECMSLCSDLERARAIAASIGRERTQLQEVIKQDARERMGLMQRISNLEAKLTAHGVALKCNYGEESFESLQEERSELQKKNTGLELAVVDLQSDLKEKENECRHVTISYKGLKKSYKASREEVAGLHNQLRDVRADLRKQKSLTAQSNELLAEEAVLRQELETHFSSLRSQVADAEQQLTVERRNHSQARQELSAANNALTNANESIMQGEFRANELEMDVQSLREKLETKTRALEELETEKQMIEFELGGKLKSTTEQQDVAQRLLTIVRGDLATLKIALKQSEKEREVVIGEREELSRRCEIERIGRKETEAALLKAKMRGQGLDHQMSVYRAQCGQLTGFLSAIGNRYGKYAKQMLQTMGGSDAASLLTPLDLQDCTLTVEGLSSVDEDLEARSKAVAIAARQNIERLYRLGVLCERQGAKHEQTISGQKRSLDALSAMLSGKDIEHVRTVDRLRSDVQTAQAALLMQEAKTTALERLWSDRACMVAEDAVGQRFRSGRRLERAKQECRERVEAADKDCMKMENGYIEELGRLELSLEALQKEKIALEMGKVALEQEKEALKESVLLRGQAIERLNVELRLMDTVVQDSRRELKERETSGPVGPPAVASKDAWCMTDAVRPPQRLAVASQTDLVTATVTAALPPPAVREQVKIERPSSSAQFDRWALKTRPLADIEIPRPVVLLPAEPKAEEVEAVVGRPPSRQSRGSAGPPSQPSTRPLSSLRASSGESSLSRGSSRHVPPVRPGSALQHAKEGRIRRASFRMASDGERVERTRVTPFPDAVAGCGRSSPIMLSSRIWKNVDEVLRVKSPRERAQQQMRPQPLRRFSHDDLKAPQRRKQRPLPSFRQQQKHRSFAVQRLLMGREREAGLSSEDWIAVEEGSK